MSYGPESGQGIPNQTAFIRNVRSKVFELLDLISHCETSESAMNAWRELCAFGYATVMDLDDRGLLPTPETSKTDWKLNIARISKLWDELKTSEKTEIKTNREGNFVTISVQWDTYIGEFPPELFMQGIQVMDKEKYDAIAHRMAQFWGYCEFVLYSCDVFNIKDQIEIPMPLDTYTGEQMAAGIGSRKVLKRGPSDQIRQK
jgi:hypothetical protein